MTQQTTISVRGEARQTVPPDQATIHTAADGRAADRPGALAAAGRIQAALLAVLRGLGAAALEVDDRPPLAWTARSLSAQREYDYQHDRPVPTGWHCHVEVHIHVRDLDRLETLTEALAGLDDLTVGHVSWSVDHDNPAWRETRAAAVHAAIEKARDYATALGGEVTAIEQLADVGLLGADPGRAWQGRGEEAFALSAGGRGASGPSLDAPPQVVGAAVDARFSAAVADL